jgi:hypothetical protein
MTHFPLQLINGHAVIQSGTDRILIDTGSPKTIHSQTTLSFMGQNFPCSTNFMGLTSNKLSDMLGSPVTTLMGMDILSKFKVLFHYQEGFIGFSQVAIPMQGYFIPFTKVMGIPIIELDVLGQKLKFFLDTGAKLSYLSTSYTAGLISQGEDTDFYPGHGTYQTPVYELNADLAGVSFPVRFGSLPPVLTSLLTMGQVQGIIGFDLFNRFQVMMDIQGNSLNIG